MQDLRAYRRLGLARLAPAALGVSLSALLLGCSSGGSSTEHVGVARQEALTAPFSTTIVLSAPQALTPTAPVLEAVGSIVVGSVATISGSTVAMGTGPGGVNAGPQAVLNDTWSRGGVNLGPQLHLTGTLHASTVTADPTAVVGTYDRTPVFDPVSTLSWNVAFPSSLSAAVHVQNAQSKALVPGGYSNLSVDAGGTLTLASGTYFLSSLTIAAGSTVKLDQANGPVIVYVSDAITINATLKSLTGDPPNLLVGFVGTGAVTLGASGAPFNGALVAPFAQLSLLQASAPHAGFFAAHDISIGALTKVQYVRPAAVIAVTSPLPFNSVATPTQLPPPPDVRGCYVGTWNGWAAVPCSPYDQLPASIRQKPYIGGGQVLLPGYLDGGIASFGPIPGISSSSGLKFGQVETTFVDVATDSSGNVESNVPPASPSIPDCNGGDPTPNSFSIQGNTNNFPAITGDAAPLGDKAWVQFVIQSQGGTNGGFDICIWNNDYTQGKADAFTIPNAGAASCTAALPCASPLSCVNGKCLSPAYWPDCLATTNYAVSVGSGRFNLAVQQRQLQTMDHATVAGSAFTDASDGQADLGLVAAVSWFDPSNNNNDYHGLYAVVTKDRYGLGATTHWTTITGTVLGLGSCGVGTFSQGSMVYTSVQAGNCATQGTPPAPATVTWPGVCPNTVAVSSSPAPIESTASLTDESNNLSIVPTSQSVLANATDGTNYLEMHYLASVDGQCVSTPRVYVKDHAQDHGSTPSNLGGEAFWESPDIIVVPRNTPVTPTSPASDPTVIAGNPYDIFVRVHNDFACNPVTGVRARVWWGDASLAVPSWTDTITNGPDPANPNWSQSKLLPSGDSLDVIGPIAWTAPTGVSPHECLLVNLQAVGETAPTNIADTPGSYQVGQRNIEIGDACSWTLSNGNKASQFGLTLTTTNNSGQSYLLTSSDSATVTFADANQALFNGWSANPHPGCTISRNGTSTVLTMTAGVGQASVKGASLPANAVVSVSSTMEPALFSGTTINLQIATFLDNGGGTISKSPTNGATCSATAASGGPK